MKRSNIIITIVIAALIALFLYMMNNQPRRYNWSGLTQRHHSAQPYDCLLMDSILKASLPNGYKVASNLYEITQDTTAWGQRYTFLINTDMIYLNKDELYSLLQDGNNFILMGVESYDVLFISSKELKQQVSEGIPLDTLFWSGEGNVMKPLYTYDRLINGVFSTAAVNDMHGAVTVLAHRTGVLMNEKHKNIYALALMSHPAGETGGIKIDLASPAIFTNYSFMQGQGSRELAMLILEQVSNLPVVRIDYSVGRRQDNEYNNDNESHSPMAFFIAHKPLRWAMWVAIVAILLGMLFTARRRQRVIPVVNEPHNETLNLIKHLGALLHRRRDNASLLNYKYQMFIDELRNRLMTEVNASEPLTDSAVQQLANVTGEPVEQLRQTLEELRSAAMSYDETSTRTTMRLIDTMDDIIEKTDWHH